MGEGCVAEKSIRRDAGCMTSVGINKLYFRGSGGGFKKGYYNFVELC